MPLPRFIDIDGVCECRPNNPHLCRLKIPQVG